MKKLPIVFLLFLIVLVLPDLVIAQCAMCAATAESSLKQGGSTIAEGLNSGILYLMSIPYIAMGTAAFFWYRHSKRNAAQKLARSRGPRPMPQM